MTIQSWAISRLGGGALTALMRSTRGEYLDRRAWDEWGGAGKPVIYALWHGRLLPLSFYHRHRGLATLISRHRDGDYIAGVVERWWGFHAIRGSSSRGGASALREIVRTLRAGTAIAITPDGPRGPRQKMKLGPVLAAQMTGVPLVPATASAEHAWWVGGWDRFLVPRPFSRVRLEFGEPLFVPRDAPLDEVERLAAELEARLNEMTERLDRSWSSRR